MDGFSKQLKKYLTEASCYFVRHGKGDHEIWYSPISKRQVTVDYGNASRHTANACLKQAGLPKRF